MNVTVDKLEGKNPLKKKNIVGKGENAGHQLKLFTTKSLVPMPLGIKTFEPAFTPFPTIFSALSRTNFIFFGHIYIVVCKCFQFGKKFCCLVKSECF